MAFYFDIFFNEIFFTCTCRVPTFKDQKVVKYGGHRGISFLRTTDYLKAIIEVYGKMFVGVGSKM